MTILRRLRHFHLPTEVHRWLGTAAGLAARGTRLAARRAPRI